MARGAALAVVSCVLLSCVVAALANCEDKTCFAGHCVFEGCQEPVNCSGGKYLFISCESPSCSGGKCTFSECANPTCDGGSCDFFHPTTTLKEGFCRGGACRVHGEEADDMGGDLAY